MVIVEPNRRAVFLSDKLKIKGEMGFTMKPQSVFLVG
jgi:putative sterol carrier protein